MNETLSPTPEAASLSVTPAPSSGTMRAVVSVYVGEECAATYSIANGEYIIGSAPDCQLVLKAEGVAPQHAKLTFRSFELLIEGLDKRSEVFIEGMQLQLPTRLRPD